MDRSSTAACLCGALLLAGILPAGAASQGRAELLGRFRRLQALKESGTPFGRVQLALWALEKGLGEEAWTLADPLAEKGLEPPGWKILEERALRFLLGKAGAGRNFKARARILLARREKPGPALERFLARALAALLKEERARGTPSPRKSLASFLRFEAERGVRPWIRRVCRLALLSSFPEDRAFVFRLALRFPTGPVRKAVLEEIGRSGLTREAAVYLGGLLLRTGPALEIRAARVLENLASPAALPFLEEARFRLAEFRSRLLGRAAAEGAAGGAGGGRSPRAYIAVCTQYSYVKDFDAQVAQSSMIADPRVGTLSGGVVLDVKILHVETVRYLALLDRSLGRALRRCSPSPGESRKRAVRPEAPGPRWGGGE